MSKGKLIVMTGLPGSGKSTIAAELGPVYSSDDIRGELFGDPSIQDHPESARKYLEVRNIHLEDYKKSKQDKLIHKASNALIFDALHKRIWKALENGETAVYDATNLSSKRRRQILKDFAPVTASSTCVYVKSSPKRCMERNAARDRKVPKKVIQKMSRSLEVPDASEGFDEIEIIEN